METDGGLVRLIRTPLMENRLLAKLAGFTYRMYGNGPYFDCDTEGCRESFPAGRIEHGTIQKRVIENGVGKWIEIPTYNFIYDENGAPCMNGEELNGCPFCENRSWNQMKNMIGGRPCPRLIHY